MLLTADQEGAAWIRAATLAGDEAKAILRYRGAEEAEPQTKAGGPAEDREAAELRPQDIRSPKKVSLAGNPPEIKLELGGSMMPYRWTINDQEYPQADPLEVENRRDSPVRAEQRDRHGASVPLARTLFLCARSPRLAQHGRSAAKGYGQRAGGQQFGAPVGGEQSRPLVLSLPYRVARRDGHGPRHRDRSGCRCLNGSRAAGEAWVRLADFEP